MSHLPGDFPEPAHLPENSPSAACQQPETASPTSLELDSAIISYPSNPPDALLFQNIFDLPAPPPPPPERIPNFAHVGILILLAILGFFCAGLVAGVGVALHLFGVSTLAQAATNIPFTLGSEGLFYLFTFASALLLFPHLWHRTFFQGIQWQAAAAGRNRGYLFGAAIACFLLALLNGLLIPGPADAPIDKMFRLPGAAWALFVFGVTFAPFFEEIAFRGFLLPAFATAFDWFVERATHRIPPHLEINGHPRWSLPAMVTASVITSLLFALLHAEQTGTTLHSLGPFLLLFCVSLVLCGVRLMLRSLAASVLVHASYNFLLFSLMFLGTSGFRHLDNM